jgi:competence protein ComEC
MGLFTTFYNFPVPVAFLFVLPFLLILFRRRLFLWFLLFWIFYFAGGLYFTDRKKFLDFTSREVYIKVHKREPYYDKYRVLAESEGNWIEFSTKYGNFKPGDFCKVTLREKKGLRLLNPFGIALEERLLSRGLQGEYQLEEKRGFYCTQSEAALIEGLRYKLFQFSEGLSPLSRGLFLALVLGVDTQLPRDYIETLKSQGLYHQLAISGFNLAVLYGLFYKFWRGLLPFTPLIKLGFPIQLWAYLFSLPGAWLILIFSGFQPPALRAFIFLSILILSKLLFKNTEALLLLLLTASLLLIFDPALIGSLSFQLSFLATLALILGDKVLRPKLALNLDQEETSLLKRLLSKALYGLGLSIMVSLFTFPFLVYATGEFPLATPLNNLLATPFWSFIFIPFSILSALLALIYPPLAGFLMERVGEVFSFYMHIPLFSFLGRSALPANLLLIWLFFMALLGALFWRINFKRGIKIFTLILLGLSSYLGLCYFYQRVSFVLIPKALTQKALLIKDRKDFYLVVKESKGSEVERSYLMIPLLKKLGVKELKALLFLSEEVSFKEYQRAFSIGKTYTLSDFELFEDLRLFKPGLEFVPLQKGLYLLEFQGLSILWDEGLKERGLPGIEVYYRLKGKAKLGEVQGIFEKERTSAAFLFPEESYFIFLDERDRGASFLSKSLFPFWTEPSRRIAYRAFED